jgi:hypothetical protein
MPETALAGDREARRNGEASRLSAADLPNQRGQNPAGRRIPTLLTTSVSRGAGLVTCADAVLVGALPAP